MSCTDDDLTGDDLTGDNLTGDELVVERDIEVAAPPDAVWTELPESLGDEVELTPAPGGPLRVRDHDGARIGVVLAAEPGARLAFRWVNVDGDAAPSEVEITLRPSGSGTIVHIRETRLDGGYLQRSAFRALARA